MDLTLTAGEFTLNVRVQIVVETQNGFLFFRSKAGHYALVGGRVKAGESSLAAAQRELEEETGLHFEFEKFKLISTIENFYTAKNSDTIKAQNNSAQETTKFHEIGFVYFVESKIVMQNIEEKFVAENNLLEIPHSEIANYNILPAVVKEIILKNNFDKVANIILN